MSQTENIQTVVDLIEHHVKQRPARNAIKMGDLCISYADLGIHANQIANGLTGLGLKPQSRIALLAKNHWCFFELFFGAAKAGFVMVPINSRLATAEISWIVNDAEAEVLIYGPEFEEKIDEIRRAAPCIKHVYALSGSGETLQTWRDAQRSDRPTLVPHGSDVCLQIYTSGTTGHPKGAQLTHTNLISCADSCIAGWSDWTEKDVCLVAMPLFHVGAVSYVFVGLRVGAELVLMQDANPAGILQAIERNRITVSLFVPAVLLMLVNLPPTAGDYSSLRMIVYGTAPMPLELLRRVMDMFDCSFVQVYGLTETTAPITYLPAADHERAGNRRMRSCGKAAPGVELLIVDQNGQPRASGEVGEIICRTAQVMKGYWKLPAATADAIRDGWLYTGDAGYLDEDGYLYIHDRIKDLIVSGGENVYPAEVENAIFGHPAVADVAVIGVPDERWGEAVKACIVLKPGQNPSAEEIITFARERIAAFKAPRSVDFLPVLPRNSTGKLLKRELRGPYWEGRDRQVN